MWYNVCIVKMMKGMIYVAMTVKEMIETLKRYPEDAKIGIYAHTNTEGGVYCKLDDQYPADDISLSDDKTEVEINCYEI